MTRDEEILKAARNYVSAVTLSSPSNVIHFENGAKWADEHPNIKSLWHNPSEEPQGDLVIIYQDKCGDCWFITKRDIVMLYINWECFAVNVRCWAYINDLLPKQFGNSKSDK